MRYKKRLTENQLMRRFAETPVRVCGYVGKVCCYEEVNAAVPTFHIGIDGRFMAGDNPYGYSDPEYLTFDALAFCAVVPSVLAKLDMLKNLMLHAHDWETAPITLFARYAVLSGVLQSAKTVLTLHNSFDAPLPNHLKRLFFNKQIDGCTILQVMIPLVNGPLTTVSSPFADDLRNDPLQCSVFVDHLQTLFNQNPPIGIENGMFGKPVLPFTNAEITAAETGDMTPLLIKKTVWRTTFLTTLLEKSEPSAIGRLNRSSLDNPSIPLLFMSGRLDLMQKGFDVVFHALRMLPPGTVQLFFSPTLHNGNENLSFFSKITEECRGDIVIWPIRIDSERYRNFLLGSSFLLMPSFYEPFGSASEGMLHGTPLIARATGGLLTQIHPYIDATNPSRYTSKYLTFNPSCQGNGLLYKEDFPDEKAKDVWPALLNTPPEQRLQFQLYQSIVDAAANALKKAVEFFINPTIYGKMILQGLHSVQEHTWDVAAKKYRAIYDVSQNRG